jgi:hypothetical protein
MRDPTLGGKWVFLWTAIGMGAALLVSVVVWVVLL